MAERIGLIRFTAMDGPSATEYAAYKKIQRRLEPDNHVKSLAESHPYMPPWRVEHPDLTKTADSRVYKLASELAPIMDEYHHHVLDVARQKAIVQRWAQYHKNNGLAEDRYYRHVDLLHAWITELLFERVYRRVGRMHELFNKVAKHEWQDTRRFFHEHHVQRFKEARVYPELHHEELELPFRHEIKLPNQKKPFDFAKENLQADRRMLVDAKLKLEELRHLMMDMLGHDIKVQLRQTFLEKRQFQDDRSRWHMHDVLRAFDKAWMHAWDSRDTFRDLIRKAVIEQAEYFPELLKKAYNNPFIREVSLPNQIKSAERYQMHIDRERTIMKLVKLSLAHYRTIATDEIEEKREASVVQHDILLNRRDGKRLELAHHRYEAHVAEGRGYIMLAGRLVPQPKIRIDTDITTGVPLSLGLHGTPSSPEQVAPLPLNLLPKQQKDVWDKLHATSAEEQRVFAAQQDEALQRVAQSIRQQSAAMEYGEQITKEQMTNLSRSSEAFKDGTKSPQIEPSREVQANSKAAAVDLRPMDRTEAPPEAKTLKMVKPQKSE